MKLETLHLTNFRQFTDFRCDFDPRLTVLVAENGGGKTSILNAITLVLVNATGNALNAGYPNNISKHDDVRTQIANRDLGRKEKFYPLEIALHTRLIAAGENRSFKCQMELANEAAEPSITVLSTQLGEPVDHSIQNALGKDASLPLLALYGTQRAWLARVRTEERSQAATFTMRNAAYLDCTNAGASYKLVLDWLDYATRSNTAEFSRHLAQNPDVAMRFRDFEGSFSPLLRAVQNAVNIVLAPSGWKNIYYTENLQDAVLEHDQFGTQPVSRLSDGIRTTIGLVADIAFRAVQLNPHLGENAALETDGIVLIDEVDMHLHPQWQQTILPDLLRAFPKLQFIVTTHSPQVLSSIKREHIRMINLESGTIPLGMSYGEPSGTVLQRVMMVDPQPPVAEKSALQELTRLVDQGHYQEPRALALMQELSSVLSEHHPQLQRLQRSIARQEALKKMAQKQ